MPLLQNNEVRKKINIKKTLLIIIISLICLRVLSVFLINYIPNLEQYHYNDFLPAFYTGDDKGYHALAKMIYNFDFHTHDWTLGFPVAIVPFMFIFGSEFNDVFFPVVLFNGFVLYSLAITLIVLSAFLVFQKVKMSALAGFGFVIFPFIFYIFRNFGPHFPSGNWNDFNFFHANWLTFMSDPLSAFLVYLIFFLMVLNAKNPITNKYFYPFVGLLSGYAMMTRVSNITIILSILITIFLFHRNKLLKNSLFFISGTVAGFLPQVIYNYKILGSPFSFGYQGAYQKWVSMGAAVRPTFSLDNIVHIINRVIEYSWLTIPAMLILGIIIFSGIFYISKIKKEYAVIWGLWFLAPVIFYASFTTGQTSARYYLPSIQPFIMILLGFFVFFKKFIFWFCFKKQHECQ